MRMKADPGNITHGAQIHIIFLYTARTITALAVIAQQCRQCLKRFQLLWMNILFKKIDIILKK